MCSCIYLLVRDELFDYVLRICIYRSCLCFVCLFVCLFDFVYVMRVVELSGYFLVSWDCFMLCLLLLLFCLFVSFVFSLFGFVLLKCLFCVSHGCSGYCYTCHFCISGV